MRVAPLLASFLVARAQADDASSWLAIEWSVLGEASAYDGALYACVTLVSEKLALPPSRS